MPFTVSHIAAALPLLPANRLLPFVAIAVGCMTPDLPLFCPWLESLGMGYATTHAWPSTIVTSWCFGWFMLLLGWWMLPALAELCPQIIRQRLTVQPMRIMFSLRWLIGGSIGLILGGLSHSVWDAFTHASGWGLNVIPALQAPITNTEIRGYQLAQHLSSLIGLLLLILMSVYKLKQQPSTTTSSILSTPSRIIFWCMLIGVTLVTGIYAAISTQQLSATLFLWITSSVQYGFIMLLIYSLAARYIRKNQFS